MFTLSQKMFSKAREVMPGGVNSPVRAFKAVEMDPIFIDRGTGAKLYDVDGNSYIDYVGSWGPLILGHAHPHIVETINKITRKGTSFGAPTALETEMARMVIEAMPSIELIRMVNSGTEAVMSALRLARGYTGRSKIIKFAGCYHGHCDSFLIKAGSGAATFGHPDSPGVTEGAARDTIIIQYNDLPAVKNAFATHGENIAAVVVEPVAANMGLILPQDSFLEGLRKLSRDYGALLIFDEVITGFRVGYGGAQEYYNIQPDLTTLGKVIGGGMPIGAYGGKREIMEQVAPSGPVYQAGTLSGNPLAMAVGIETLKILQTNRFYENLVVKREKLTSGLATAAHRHGVKIYQSSIGSMFGTFFSADPVFNFKDALKSDSEAFKIFFRTMLKEGVYLAPSPFETGFISSAHSEEDITFTIEAADKAFEAVKKYFSEKDNSPKLAQ
ncbi:MAG: glutamate-1-semialdehyde 2,1-aminomutase [Bacillota bacterium]